MQHYHNTYIQELNRQLTSLRFQLETVKKKTSEELNKISNLRQEDFLWDAPLENL